MIIEAIRNAALFSAGSWAIRTTAAKLIGNRQNRSTPNVSNPTSFRSDFAKRELTQNILRAYTPIALGLLGVVVSLGQAAAGNFEKATFLFSSGIVHIAEGIIYAYNHGKEISNNEEKEKSLKAAKKKLGIK